MKCRICDSLKTQLFAIEEMMYGSREIFDYYKCENCGCLQISEYPQDIGKYYPVGYYSYGGSSHRATLLKRILKYFIHARNRYEAQIKKTVFGKLASLFKPNIQLRREFNFVNKYLKDYQKGKILDVGCGSDHFLKLFEGSMFSEKIGVDPYVNHDYQTENGEIKILKRNLFDLSGNYDVIFFNHSLEHMGNQFEVLKKTASILDKNGLIFIRVPVIDSFAWEKYGTKWIQIDPPRHFYLHSKNSLKILSKSCGLDIIDIGFDSYSLQFWGSEQAVANIALVSGDSVALGSRKLFSNAQIKEFERQSDDLNHNGIADQAIFVLKHLNA